MGTHTKQCSWMLRLAAESKRWISLTAPLRPSDPEARPIRSGSVLAPMWPGRGLFDTSTLGLFGLTLALLRAVKVLCASGAFIAATVRARAAQGLLAIDCTRNAGVLLRNRWCGRTACGRA